MSLADDWGKYGITVNCLAPGWFRTEQNKVLYQDKEWVEYLCHRIPLKRPGKPSDLDSAVVFLAAESSRYITGQTILVDGGISTGATRALVNAAKRETKRIAGRNRRFTTAQESPQFGRAGIRSRRRRRKKAAAAPKAQKNE